MREAKWKRLWWMRSVLGRDTGALGLISLEPEATAVRPARRGECDFLEKKTVTRELFGGNEEVGRRGKSKRPLSQIRAFGTTWHLAPKVSCNCSDCHVVCHPITQRLATRSLTCSLTSWSQSNRSRCGIQLRMIVRGIDWGSGRIGGRVSARAGAKHQSETL